MHYRNILAIVALAVPLVAGCQYNPQPYSRPLAKVTDDMAASVARMQAEIAKVKEQVNVQVAEPVLKTELSQLSRLNRELSQAEQLASPEEKQGLAAKKQQINEAYAALRPKLKEMGEMVAWFRDGTGKDMLEFKPTGAPQGPAGLEPSFNGKLMLWGIMLGILVGCLGMLHTEGMWSNAIRLVNVVTAGLLAMNFYEPVAGWMADMMPSFAAVWDYLALWGVFVVALIVLRTVTDQLCRTRVRFLKLADDIGSWVFAFLIGWVMVCFTLTAMHTAPLGKNFLLGAFQPEQKMFFGMAAPDLQWLGFTKMTSGGAYSCWTPEQFDPGCQFVARQTERREIFERYINDTGAVRIDPDRVKKTR